MADDGSIHRSRRAVLGAAVGAMAATVAQALGRPSSALAGVDGDVVLGSENRSTSTTSTLNDDASSATASFLGWTYGTGVGVAARSLLGTGLRAQTDAANGTAGEFISPVGGTGLRVVGKARFDRSGVATVPAGRSYVDVTVPGGLTSNSIVIATIQGYRSGVAVSGVRRNYPSAGRARIYLTKVASSSSTTPVGWFVVS